jgi:hypothetical protein
MFSFLMACLFVSAAVKHVRQWPLCPVGAAQVRLMYTNKSALLQTDLKKKKPLASRSNDEFHFLHYSYSVILSHGPIDAYSP